MVQINYCSKCNKAKREHLFKTVECPDCNSPWESKGVPRSKYFRIMLPFLIFGFLFHMAALMLYIFNRGSEDGLSAQRERMIGLMLLGVGMYIMSIGFQILDSKQMEKDLENEMAIEGSGKKKRDIPVRGPSVKTRDIPVRGPKKSEEPKKEGKDIPVRKPKSKGDEEEKEEKGKDKEDDKDDSSHAEKSLDPPATSTPEEKGDMKDEKDKKSKKGIKGKKSKDSKMSKKEEPPPRKPGPRKIRTR